MSKGGIIETPGAPKEPKCDGHYFFILVLVIQEETHALRGKRVYIFLRKRFSQMRILFEDT